MKELLRHNYRVSHNSYGARGASVPSTQTYSSLRSTHWETCFEQGSVPKTVDQRHSYTLEISFMKQPISRILFCPAGFNSHFSTLN